jgi:tetraacyldisaccharide 4'-kinase
MIFRKPYFWDYKKPNFLSYILLPLTFPLIINNFLLKYKKKDTPNHKTKKICIGNIYVGGTGKTPLVIKIYQILNDLKFKTATIKKFYTNHIDEQKMLNDKTELYCLKNRSAALQKTIKDNKDVVIFDDGLQDRSINFDLKFVCFNNKKWIGNGLLMPAGPLREKIQSILKYDALFINGNDIDNSHLKLIIRKYNKDIKIFESHYSPTNINHFSLTEKYLIFSGIGNPDAFRETLKTNNINIIKEVIFPDHYNYTQNDINKIRSEAKKLNAKIITTEKDFVKINSSKNDDIKFLEIELKVKNEEQLIDYLKTHI